MTIIVEHFEGLTPSANAPLWPEAPGFLQVGVTSAFTFSSGARLIAPIPNTDLPNAATVGDFAISPLAGWGLNFVGDVNTAGDLPGGTAYIGRNNDGAGGTLAFGFNTTVFAVGGFVNSTDHINLTAYDAVGKAISGASIRSVTTSDWDTNFVQVVSKVPIARVVFTGGFVILDDLTFDTSKPNIVKGGGGDDNLSGTDGTELILGRKGNDKINGKGDDDTIDGSKGNDKIHGGDGNDSLVAGNGNDKLWGDADQDSFLFRKLGFVTTLKDFNPVEDTILLERATFIELAPGPLGDTQFVLGAAAADPLDRIIYDPATGNLSYDIDGSGPTTAILFAKLPGGLAVTVADFFVL